MLYPVSAILYDWLILSTVKSIQPTNLKPFVSFVSYAWDPNGNWTNQHQMSVNNKRQGFERKDLTALASMAGIKKGRANETIDRVIEAVRCWPEFAEIAGVAEERMKKIQDSQRTHL